MTDDRILLEDGPTDGITNLEWLENGRLISSSWDGNLYLHDVQGNTQLQSYSLSVPVLDTAVIPEHTVYAGCLDGTLQTIDVESSTISIVGKNATTTTDHPHPGCSCVRVVDQDLVVSAGWDQKLRLWDIRTSNSNNTSCIDWELPGKAFSADVHDHTMVVATSGKRIVYFDVRKNKPDLIADQSSTLKYQTRCVRFFNDGTMIAQGSVEGRVAVEYRPGVAGKNYAFKCHRSNNRVYPVNVVEFHPKHGTFATGGCDGTVVFWDGWAKKKLSSLEPLPSSVASLAASPDGSQMAMASSYTFEEGEKTDRPRDEIYVQTLQEAHILPKQQKS